MPKKLAAKIQQLNPAPAQYGTSFAKCIVIEPETRELLSKKGCVYAVYEVESDANFDVALIERVLNDIIHNSYYQSENVSPIQSMEKAIVDARDKVVQLSNDALRAEPTNVKFKITAAILWGNVLYVAQYDKAESFLMREGNIKPISTMTEGTFSAASGVVKEDDVIILCTHDFAKAIPPQKLLSLKLQEENLPPTHACLLMKLFVDTSFTDNELASGVTQKEPGALQENVKKVTQGVADVKKSLKQKTSGINFNIKIPKIKLPTKLLKFSATTIYTKTKAPFDVRKRKGLLLLVLLAIALVLSITITKLTKSRKAAPAVAPNSQATTTEQNGQALKQQEENDKQYKIERVIPQIIYDIKITDPQAQPTEITNTQDVIIVTDKSTGKIYTSPKNAVKFETLATPYPGIKSTLTDKNKLYALDNQGYKIIDPQTGDTLEKYALSGAIVASIYSDYLYVISGDTLTRYSHQDNELQGVMWGENAAFANARSIAIAYSIYVLTNDGNLEKYTGGNKVAFSLKGVDGTLEGAIKVVANNNLTNVYILDPQNQRILILDSEGNMIKQYKARDPENFLDLKSFDVSPDEKSLYILDGSKVETINL